MAACLGFRRPGGYSAGFCFVPAIGGPDARFPANGDRLWLLVVPAPADFGLRHELAFENDVRQLLANSPKRKSIPATDDSFVGPMP